MIRPAEEKDRPALEELYNLCFPGEPDFCRWFFDCVYRPGNTLVLTEKNILVSALQMLPIILSDGKRQANCGYLYAVGTRPEYRGGGRMARLLEESFAVMRGRGDSLAVLITQEPSLIRFYARFGFQPVFSRQMRRTDGNPLPQGYTARPAVERDIPVLDEIYSRGSAGIWHPLRSGEGWKRILRQYGKGARVLLAPGGRISAYALLEEGIGAPNATEAAGADVSALMAGEAARLGTGPAQWYGPSFSSDGEQNGCALALTDEGEEILACFGGRGYLNVLFN